MKSDLLVAVPVALLVAVLPGYPWARALRAGSDLPERLAWSVGLSLSLVPSVALLFARIAGTGVTLPIALVSVPLVTLSGAFAARRWRYKEGRRLPSVRDAPPLSSLAVAPLAVAMLLLLSAIQDARPQWVLLPSLLQLAVLAGLLVAWTEWRYSGASSARDRLARGDGASPSLRPSQRSTQGPSAGPETFYGETATEARQPRWGQALLAAVGVATLVRAYIGPVRHDWPYVRGVDQFSHAVLTNLTMSTGDTDEYLSYPSGFPVLTAILSRLTGLDPLRLYPVLGPALLLLPAIGCYALARRLWGWPYGVAAAALAGVLLGGSYLYFFDSMYPNLIAAQFLLVLAAAALVGVVDAPSPGSAVLLALLGSSVVLYHSVSTLYLAALLAFVSVFLLPALLLRDRARGVPLLGALCLTAALSAAYAWEPYHVPQTVASLLGWSGKNSTVDAAGMAIGTQDPFEWPAISRIVGAPVVWFGLLGALLLATRIRRLGRLGLFGFAVLAAWVLLLYAGSRTARSGFPHRFARDLGVPLCVLGGYAVVSLLRGFSPRRPAGLFASALAVSLLLTASLAGVRAADRPSNQLLVSRDIEAAGRWLREHNTGGSILVSPHVNQVPSRAMLAMGRYSGLQSYAPWQLERKRDLPPPERVRSVEDVLWVVRRPTGERTRRILARYDVRYVVLYKEIPAPSFWHNQDPVDMEAFERSRSLYDVALENDGVLILRVQRSRNTPARSRRSGASLTAIRTRVAQHRAG